MKMMFVIICLSVLYYVAVAKPIDDFNTFINADNYLSMLKPELMFHNAPAAGTHLRTKRSMAEECEELELCKLHARSAHSIMAAFQLYFVNKENAHLWDHKSRSMSECEEQFSCNSHTKLNARENNHKHINDYDNINNVEIDYGDEY